MGLCELIHSGVITKSAVIGQVAKFNIDKMETTRNFLARKIDRSAWEKRLAELNFCVTTLQTILDRWDDFKLPLKLKPTGGTDNEPNFSTEG